MLKGRGYTKKNIGIFSVAIIIFNCCWFFWQQSAFDFYAAEAVSLIRIENEIKVLKKAEPFVQRKKNQGVSLRSVTSHLHHFGQESGLLDLDFHIQRRNGRVFALNVHFVAVDDGGAADFVQRMLENFNEDFYCKSLLFEQGVLEQGSGEFVEGIKGACVLAYRFF